MFAPCPALLLLLRIAAVLCVGVVLGRRVEAAPRVPNTTLQLPAEPGSFGYSMQRFLGPLTFPNGVALRTPPGETNRLFVLERAGRIAVVPNLTAPTREVFLDLTARVRTDNFNEMGLLGFTFHPQYATNGRFFVWYTTTATTTGAINQRHDRLSEFRVRSDDPQRADLTSEKILLQQADEAVNHNGGDLHFGADGYLYVSLGDEGGGNNQYANAQKITKDFFAGLLRLDVDQRPGSLAPNPHPAVVPGAYRIPADNPFVGATNFLGRAVAPATVRTEFWAVGLRNPWRFSFDEPTGELWVGEVGQNVRESVTLSRSGANHGWAFREGNIAGPDGGAPADFLTNPVHRYVPPLFTYGHQSGAAGGFSITGGRVYRGSRLAQLFGAYVFADYVNGNLWALRRSPTGGAPTVTRLTGASSLAAFGSDPRNGDLLAVNHDTGQLFRLDYSTNFTGAALPAKLSATGAFTDLATLTPAAGILPYELNLPFWSDGALKSRWFSVPDPTRFLTFQPDGAWTAPAGTVWVKHFDFELTNGVALSRRRLETRFLVRNTAGVYGITYRWNAEQTDAELVPESGAEEDFTVTESDGSTRGQHWRYPSRAECLVCHNAAAGGTLGFNTAQLHRTVDDHGQPTQQILAWQAAGYFGPTKINPNTRPVLAAPADTTASLTWRARSWIAVNCAYCHRPGGLGGAQFDARFETPLESARILFGNLNNTVDNPGAIVVPGNLELSELHARLSERGPGQMPPLATSRPDPAGAAVVAQWILAAAPRDSYEGWRSATFPAPLDSQSEPLADPDQDHATNDAEFRLDTSPLTADPAWRLQGEWLADQRFQLSLRQPANRALLFEQSTGLDPSDKWEPVDAADALPTFPATAGTRKLVIEPGEPARYYRVRLLLP